MLVCDQCDREYKSRRALRTHIAKDHTTERPFLCTDCGKAYAVKLSLIRHQKRVHHFNKGSDKQGNEEEEEENRDVNQ